MGKQVNDNDWRVLPSSYNHLLMGTLAFISHRSHSFGIVLLLLQCVYSCGRAVLPSIQDTFIILPITVGGENKYAPTTTIRLISISSLLLEQLFHFQSTTNIQALRWTLEYSACWQLMATRNVFVLVFNNNS